MQCEPGQSIPYSISDYSHGIVRWFASVQTDAIDRWTRYSYLWRLSLLLSLHEATLRLMIAPWLMWQLVVLVVEVRSLIKPPAATAILCTSSRNSRRHKNSRDSSRCRAEKTKWIAVTVGLNRVGGDRATTVVDEVMKRRKKIPVSRLFALTKRISKDEVRGDVFPSSELGCCFTK